MDVAWFPNQAKGYKKLKSPPQRGRHEINSNIHQTGFSSKSLMILPLKLKGTYYSYHLIYSSYLLCSFEKDVG